MTETSHTEAGYEKTDASVPLLVGTGIFLLVSIALTLLIVWGLFHYFWQREDRTKTTSLPLVREEMGRLPPPPRLEGFEPVHDRLVLRTVKGDELTFDVDAPIVVERDGDRVGLFDLGAGSAVTLEYQAIAGRNRPLALRSPPIDEPPEGYVPGSKTQAINGILVRVEAKSLSERRAAAEAELRRYGWVEKKDGIAHIPIDPAMDVVAEQYRGQKPGGKDQGVPIRPSASNSGRGAVGGER